MKLPRRLQPVLIDSLREYSRRTFTADLAAGITVGLVALPLAMAFAIASGVKPEAGIYTAIVAGLVVSVLGGSRCQISGPTGAFVVIVAGIVAQHGISGLLTCTLMAGGMLLLLGLTGLGAAVRYIPRSVTIGFTNGIAILIATTQIKDFFGLSTASTPHEFLPRMTALAAAADTINPASLTLALITLAIVILWPRITRRVPGSIVALVVTTLIAVSLNLKVATIGSAFGGIPAGLPQISLPQFQFDKAIDLLPSAMTVALLAALESLLSAVVADNMTGDRHRPDAELVAQGAANLIVPFVGGIPITGAIARTATNIRTGGRTPVAGIIHGLVLLAVILAAAPLASHIPLPTLAAILMVVAYNMGEWREIPGILKLSGPDRLVWAVTFALTVAADLTLAVQVGMILAALLYIRQVSDATTVMSVTEQDLEDVRPQLMQDRAIPGHVTLFRIQGSFMFGATGKLDDAAEQIDRARRVVILKLHHMSAIDATGIHALESFAERVRASGRALMICGARKQPLKLILRSRLPRLIGEANILPHVEAALQRADVEYGELAGVGSRMADTLRKALV